MITAAANDNNNEVNNADQTSSEKSTFITLEGLVEAALCIDTKGTLIYANAAAREFFSYSEMEMVGHNISMLMPSPYKVFLSFLISYLFFLFLFFIF